MFSRVFRNGVSDVLNGRWIRTGILEPVYDDSLTSRDVIPILELECRVFVQAAIGQYPLAGCGEISGNPKGYPHLHLLLS